MSEFPDETGSGETADGLTAADRRCIACGYNLRGLGEEPRCPECGLLHVPAHFRQQVWDLVDSGKWFFSGMFSPLAKRLPGWWWALDREGDVAKSFWVAARNIILAAIIIFVAAATADAWVVEQTQVVSGIDIDGSLVSDTPYRRNIGLFRSYEEETLGDRLYRWQITNIRVVTRIKFAPSISFVFPGIVAFVLACLVWLCPSCVGLWTQIRKGLPSFAKAPRTILAAANLESHRVMHNAFLVAMWMVIELLLRWSMGDTDAYDQALVASVAGIYLIAALGWIGPLRSDYTRQLIRSRWHAARIIVMYALAPLHMCWILVLAVVLHEWLDRIW